MSETIQAIVARYRKLAERTETVPVVAADLHALCAAAEAAEVARRRATPQRPPGWYLDDP